VYPWGTELGAYWWQFLLAGVAAAVVGLGLGEALAGRRRTLPGVAAVAGVLVVAGLLGYHVLARHAEPVRVTLTSQAAGPVVAARDREGDFNPGGPVIVTAQVSPASAVGNPDFFEVTAWQGHGRTVHRRLIADGGGRYHADGPIPTGGDWKSIVILNRGDVLEAVPVAMPADRSYGLGLISPPGDGRSADFVPAQNLLMREFHGGLTPVGVIATTLFLAFIVAWVGAMFVAAAGLPGGGAALTWPPLARRRRPALG
jgi:hypothetical protein